MRQILLFIFLVLLIFNGRAQSSSLDSLKIFLPEGKPSGKLKVYPDKNILLLYTAWEKLVLLDSRSYKIIYSMNLSNNDIRSPFLSDNGQFLCFFNRTDGQWNSLEFRTEKTYPFFRSKLDSLQSLRVKAQENVSDYNSKVFKEISELELDKLQINELALLKDGFGGLNYGERYIFSFCQTGLFREIDNKLMFQTNSQQHFTDTKIDLTNLVDIKSSSRGDTLGLLRKNTFETHVLQNNKWKLLSKIELPSTFFDSMNYLSNRITSFKDGYAMIHGCYGSYLIDLVNGEIFSFGDIIYDDCYLPGDINHYVDYYGEEIINNKVYCINYSGTLFVIDLKTKKITRVGLTWKNNINEVKYLKDAIFYLSDGQYFSRVNLYDYNKFQHLIYTSPFPWVQISPSRKYLFVSSIMTEQIANIEISKIQNVKNNREDNIELIIHCSGNQDDGSCFFQNAYIKDSLNVLKIRASYKNVEGDGPEAIFINDSILFYRYLEDSLLFNPLSGFSEEKLLNSSILALRSEIADAEERYLSNVSYKGVTSEYDNGDAYILVNDIRLLKISKLQTDILIRLVNSPYYMCSKNASKMVHYVTPSLKVIGFDQLDPIYNRPDIVLDSIGKYFGGADQELIVSYREAWEKRVDRLGLDKDMLATGEIAVPEGEIVNEVEFKNTSGEVKVVIKANDPKYELRRFNVLVNEVPVYGSHGISISHLHTKGLDTTVSVPLTVGENKLQVSVMNELGLENFKYPTYVNYTPNNEIISKTYFIGIGVDDFEEDGHDLNYCVKDIEDLSNAFKSSKNTDTIILTNEQVTKENILALKNTLKNTRVHDKVIISCSSHGLLDDENRFYLATHDVDFSHPEYKGLPYAELEGLLDSIPARQKLLMLDACNSGENEIEQRKRPIAKTIDTDNENQGKTRGEILVDDEQEFQSSFETMMELFVNVSNETGSVIISAAGGKQSALEGEAVKIDGKKIENGAFTYSVLEYLKQTEATLTVNGLKSYVEKRVEEITKGKQRPTSRQETMEVDWDLR